MTDDLDENSVRDLVENKGLTYGQISELCKSLRLGQGLGCVGFSERNIRWYCAIHGIKKRSGITSGDIDRIVSSFVSKVALFLGIMYVGKFLIVMSCLSDWLSYCLF